MSQGNSQQPGYYTEPCVDPKTIGYPANPDEMKAYMKKQAQRHWKTQNANGLLTWADRDAILRARARRARQAKRQVK